MGLIDTAYRDGRKWTRIGKQFGVTKKPRELDLPEGDPINFYPMDSIPQSGAYEPPTSVPKSVGDITSGTYFEVGDVLVAKITPSFENGKQALVRSMSQKFGYATTEVIPLHALSRRSDPRFLFFYLLHPDVRHYIAERMEGSTGRQRVSEGLLLEVPMPDFEEKVQSRIADALELIRVLATIEQTAVASATELKAAAMQQLFSRGLHDEAQKSTNIGFIPASWNLVDFREVREFLQYGTSIHCTAKPDRYPVLRIPNIEPGRVNSADLKYCRLPSVKAKRYELQPGDLLFIRTNGVIDRLGSCAVYEGEPSSALFASYLIRARLTEHVLPKYAAYFFGSPLGTSLVAGRAAPASDGKYNLNTGTIDALPLPLPPTIDQQMEIVEVLDAADRKIELHRRKRDLFEQLFNSLMHKLMIGEISIDDLDLSALPTKDGSAA